MSRGIIGKKVGMTSMFSEDGKNTPCTVIEAGPCVVTQIRTAEKDGYDAVQLAYGDRKEKNTPGALLGHFKKAKTTPKTKLVEFSGFENELSLGDEVSVDIFEQGEWIDVVGITKGKGFQGVVKRHNFAGVGGQTHGQHNRERHPGSIGGASTPSRVYKGMKMGGQTGATTVTMENIKVMKVYADKNLLVVKGSIPGYKGSYVILDKQN